MVRRVSILLVTSEFPPGPGGIGNHAWNLAKSLSLVHEVIVVTDSRSSFLQEEFFFDSKQNFIVRRARRNKGKWIGIASRLILFSQVLSSTGKETVVIMSGKFPMWFGAVVRFFFRKKKWVAVLHGSEINFKKGWKRRMTAWALGRNDQLIAVSRFTRMLALKHNPNLQIEVIPNGFNPDKIHFAQNGETLGQPALITVGSVSLRKGQHNVAAALPLLTKTFSEISYHVVGIKREPHFLNQIVAKEDLSNRVHIYGSLSDAQMTRVLKGSDVFVMLSDEQPDGDVEGFGIAILEANAVGLPAIGSKNCGIEDAIADGISGRLVDPHKPEDFQNALADIMANYERYSSQAKAWAGKFHWNKIAEQYKNILGR